MNDTASTMISADATLHLWGPAAVEPDAFDRVIAAHRARHAGRAPQLAVTPSHWGGRRRELLARALLGQGADAGITDIATQLLAAEPPVAAHTILVELEPGRMCVSRLDFGAGTTTCRLTHRTGDRLAIIADLTADLLADDGPTDDVEYIVTGDDGVFAGLRRRGHLVFPVPEPELRRIRSGERGSAPDEALGDARDYGTTAPETWDSGGGVGANGVEADGSGANDSIRATHPAAGRDPGVAPILDVTELRRRARDVEEASASKKLRAPVGVAAGALVIVGFVAVTAILGSGPAGPRDDGGIAAAGIAESGTGGADPGGGAAVEAGEESGEESGGELGEGSGEESGRDGLGEPDRESGGDEVGHVLRANGIQVTLPPDWEVDAGARPDGLVAVNGGRMRILAIATPVPEGTPLEDLAASIGTRAAADPTADRVRRELVEGIDVVTHEERPGDGTVVYWQHRIVGPWQLSVGCQWRDPTIPQHRPICGQALRSVGVAGNA